MGKNNLEVKYKSHPHITSANLKILQMPVDGSKLNRKQGKSLQTETNMVSINNPWHNLLMRKKDYNPPISTRHKDTKRPKKLFVDMLEGEYASKN